MQVSRSKKWLSKPALDETGNPVLQKNGKPVLKKSYSILQDDFYQHMRAAGYTDVERGERGSTEEHLTVTQFMPIITPPSRSGWTRTARAGERKTTLTTITRESVYESDFYKNG